MVRANFNQVENRREVSYNAIFYSAFKALVVFELLLESPKTLEQISQALINMPYIKSKISKDTLRVYINSFKIAGCNVQKKLTGEKHRQYAYFIPENPFKPIVSNEQAKTFFNIYDMIAYNMDFEQILYVDLLFRKLDNSFQNLVFHKLYEEHSMLKNFDLNLLKLLEKCCKDKCLVTVLYNSPRSGLKPIPIVAHKLKIQNYKLYLEGFGKEYNHEGIFLVSRIEKVLDITPANEMEPITTQNQIEIICEFYDSNTKLMDNETLLCEKDGIRIIKHVSGNKVLSNHRFLQLADKCKLIKPIEYKEEFINLLKSTREVYNNAT